MKKYLPTHSEFRIAIFTSITLILLIGILSFIGKVTKLLIMDAFGDRYEYSRMYMHGGRNFEDKWWSNDDASYNDLMSDIQNHPIPEGPDFGYDTEMNDDMGSSTDK